MTIPADYFLNTRTADLWTSLRNIFAADLREFRRPIRVSVLDAAGAAFQLRQETLESVFEATPDSVHLSQENLCLPLSIVFVDLDGRELNACLKLSQDAAVGKTKEPAMYGRPIGSELWHSSPACPQQERVLGLCR